MTYRNLRKAVVLCMIFNSVGSFVNCAKYLKHYDNSLHINPNDGMSESSIKERSTIIQELEAAEDRYAKHANDIDQTEQRTSTSPIPHRGRTKESHKNVDFGQALGQIVGEEVVPLVQGKQPISNYTKWLFHALQEEDQYQTHAPGAKVESIPTIRTRHGVFGRCYILAPITTWPFQSNVWILK